MRILITGSEGTLGRPLRYELERNGHDVWGLDLTHTADPQTSRADVADYRQLDRVLQQALPDLVFHLAAEFGRMNGEDYWEQVWRSNAIGTKNILMAQKHYGFRLVHASSSEIYGDPESDSAISEDLTEESPVFPGNDYAISKWANELQIRNHAAQGQEIMTLRFFNAYGPGERYTPYRSVVCLFCYRLLAGLPITVYRDYWRVFMYIDDFIPTLARAADQFIFGETINIGGVEYRSVEELVQVVRSYVPTTQSIITYEEKDGHNVASKKPDISRARKLLDHNPTIPLEDGVARTVQWMREEYGL